MKILDIKNINNVPIKIDIIEQVGLANVRTDIPMTSQCSITVHNTANNAPSANDEMHHDYFKQLEKDDDLYVGAMIFVAEDSITQILPLDEVVYHTSNSESWYTSISIEICENGNYEKAEENAIALIAYLMNKLNIKLDKLVTHQFWTGKYCPHIILDSEDGFEGFKEKVANEMVEELTNITANEIIEKAFSAPEDWIDGCDLLEQFGAIEGNTGAYYILKYIRPAFEKVYAQGVLDGIEKG